jgi:hypothetical protein
MNKVNKTEKNPKYRPNVSKMQMVKLCILKHPQMNLTQKDFILQVSNTTTYL